MRGAALAQGLPKDNLVAGLLRAFVRGARAILRGNLHVLVEQDVALLAETLAKHSASSGVRIAPRELVEAIEQARRITV